MAVSAKSLANLRPCKPGETHNPGGTAVGTRNRVCGAFLRTLADDFDEHGKAAIAACRKRDPAAYVRAIAGLLPKEFVLQRPTEGLSDDELIGLIGELRARLAGAEGAGSGTLIEAEPQSADRVPALQPTS